MNDLTLENNARALVNNLFKSFAAIFPAFKQAWPTQSILNSSKEQFVLAFIENNIVSDVAIKKGLKKARASGSVFMLSPGQFAHWCKLDGSDAGVKEVREAYKEACYNASNIKYEAVSWSHDVIYYAAKQIGFYELTNMTSRQSYNQFQHYYDKGIELYLNGQLSRAPEPQKKLYKKPNINLSVGSDALKNIRKTLGQSSHKCEEKGFANSKYGKTRHIKNFTRRIMTQE